MTISIEADRLGLRYGETTALDDITFTLESGKIYGLLGRNGAGKSSLLAVLAGLRKASSGTLSVDGRPVFENPAITRQIFLIREAGDTLDRSEQVKTALEFAEYLRPAWDSEFAGRLLDLFELSPRKKISELPRGKRSALGIILGLAARAPITMFDESHLGMDVPSRYTFYDELLADFIAYPRTFVISTHLIDELGAILERVLILDSGRLLMHESTEELLSQGAEITGPAAEVDRVLDGLRVLRERSLGRTKWATVYGALDAQRRDLAHAAGLEVGPIGLQDLFVHLTEPERQVRLGASDAAPRPGSVDDKFRPGASDATPRPGPTAGGAR
jgi:ABC-2 type transport system ATP-binding protein